MKELDNVTLLVVSSIKFKSTLHALEECRKKIKFHKTLLISHEKPAFYPDDIEWQECPRICNINDYNRYMIYDLHKHVETDFCLCINYDGYVVNPDKWDDEFLNWDYIGAPWLLRNDAYIDPFGNHIRVGNGGFSLRSRKLLNVPNLTEVPFEVNTGNFYKHMNAGLYNEDGNICVHNRHIFEKFGCKFAPLEVAIRFSKENEVPEAVGIDAFGFHNSSMIGE